jgi:hypothetical protein
LNADGTAIIAENRLCKVEGLQSFVRTRLVLTHFAQLFYSIHRYDSIHITWILFSEDKFDGTLDS